MQIMGISRGFHENDDNMEDDTENHSPNTINETRNYNDFEDTLVGETKKTAVQTLVNLNNADIT